MPDILVVDDRPHRRQLFGEDLMDEGYIAVGAEDCVQNRSSDVMRS